MFFSERFAHHLLSLCSSYEIIGSTLVKTKQPYNPFFTTSAILDILRRSEPQTWAGCPAELLYVLTLINAASSDLHDRPPESIHEVFILIERFSPMKWAITSANTQHVKSRYHLACIWQAAAEIYALQVLQIPPDRHEPHEQRISNSIDSVLLQLQAMDPQDVHLKGLLWPTFVIGAEAQTVAERAIIREVFGHLWALWRCGNVTNALKLLERIWAQRATKYPSGRWIESVYEMGENWMFI